MNSKKNLSFIIFKYGSIRKLDNLLLDSPNISYILSNIFFFDILLFRIKVIFSIFFWYSNITVIRILEAGQTNREKGMSINGKNVVTWKNTY